MKRLLVDQTNIRRTQVEDISAPPLGEGQARLKLQRFALTANNITYAASGHVLGYWRFFPSGIDGQGLLPVWGFAEVVESQSPHAPIGTRYYGFFPLAEEVILIPEPEANTVITDAALHRADLPPVYNRYGHVPEREPTQEFLQALLQPLLATSYLLQDWLTDNAYFGAEQIIIGSASSKTGLGLIKYLAELQPRPVQIIGLTSAGNRAFVDSLNACDQVLGYDEIETLPQRPSVYVDMAGNAEVKQRLHSHLDSHLQHSCAVGTSHWDKFAPKQELAGPKPQFFFAPAQIEKRRADWGPGVIEQRISEAWRRIAAEATDWLALNAQEGFDEVQSTYASIADGTASPRDGHVFTL